MFQHIGGKAVIESRIDMVVTRGPLWGKDAGRQEFIGTVHGGTWRERFMANARIWRANLRAYRRKWELRLQGVKA